MVDLQEIPSAFLSNRGKKIPIDESKTRSFLVTRHIVFDFSVGRGMLRNCRNLRSLF